MLFALMACSGGSSNSESPNAPASTDLEIGRTQSGYIETDDDVDIYRLTANETNRYMLVHCAEATSGSGVDLLVTVYEDVDGDRRRIFGKHKPQGASLSADLDLWIYINEPKTIIIEVRDLMADDHNTEIPYSLTCSYQDSVDGNHDFSSARDIAIGADGAISDNIGEIGEVDCFTFSPQTDGVYSLNVDHFKPNGGSAVELAVSLYDKNGNPIIKVTDPNHTILAYLESAGGPYFVAVEDSDRSDGDAAATYEISVVAVTFSGQDNNNVVADAERIDPDSDNVYTITGAIDYGSSSISPDLAGDKDWYSVIVGAVGGETTYHPIEMTISDSAADDSTARVLVTVFDSEMKTVTYYDYKAGDPAYTNQIRVENGEYFILVEPAGASQLTQSTAYQVQLREVAIDDSAEISDRNTADTAMPLTEGAPLQGYVSYLSDVDWYSINVDTTSDSVLSVDLTSAQSIVDYQISIWLGDRMIKKVDEPMSSDAPTHLKTSILIPSAGASSSADYHIKVCDAQNNEGSELPYTVTADISSLGPAPEAIAQTGGITPIYYDETGMEASQTDELELEIFSTLQPKYKYNTDLLDFRTHTEYQSAGADGTTVITMPWISGYVDYQGDRDFFQLDLGPLGAETTWYYDVEVQLVVPSASSVEYVWKFYLDNNVPDTIMDDPTSSNGYKACAGDIEPEVQSAIDLVTPTGEETFWFGNEMAADAKFFIGLSDFNYLKLAGTESTPEADPDNPNPDADWSYEEDPAVPYYFRITLTYHPNQSRPD
jgi:hypothetical protein